MENTVYKLVSIVLLIVYARLRAGSDKELIVQYGKNLNGTYKFYTSCMTVLMCSMFALILKELWFKVATVFIHMLAYGFIFDSMLNKLRGEKVDHMGTGPIDKFWKKIPYQWLVRLILILITYTLWFIHQ